jgi:acetaldehyde dehydrogenase
MARSLAAIVGSGNIGTDLLIKLMRKAASAGAVLEPALLCGIDPNSDGLARAKEWGIDTTADGIEGLRRHPRFADIGVVFDATSAKAHLHHAAVLRDTHVAVVDLTPAAVGPLTVPVVNGEQHAHLPNVNLVTCGGQATIPMVAAVARVCPVSYAEIVASIASKSAGPGTRANIDEFTQTTSRGIEQVGGASRGKAIIVLNPAEPPVIMRDTVHAFTPMTLSAAQQQDVHTSIERMVAAVARYVPGYRLVQQPVITSRLLQRPGELAVEGTQITVFLEVEGAGHYLPTYAGNLDIMTSAAMRMGELMAEARA